MPSCAPPSTGATLEVLSVEESTATVRLNGGNGEARLVVIAPAEIAMAHPYQGDAYVGDLSFGAGDELGYQTFALSATTDMTVDLPITGLTPGTAYQVAVYEYNLSQMCYALNPMSLELTTACDTEARPVGSVLFTSADQEVALGWEAPACADRFLVLASENPITGSPIQQDYDASTTYATVPPAAEFSAGTYPVYFGSGTDPIVVDGLDNETTSHFAVFTSNQGVWSAGFYFSATPEEGCDDQNGERLFINEFHYRNGPVNQDLGAEIAGPAGVDLAPYELIVIRVAGATTPVYIEQYRVPLAGIIDDEGQGFGAVWFPLDELPSSRGMLVLRNTLSGDIVDQVGYDSRFGLLTQVGTPHTNPIWTLIPELIELPTDPPGFSIQRIGEGECPTDFLWAQLPNTRGYLNIGQVVLPVELNWLAAEPVGKSARVYWQTATESGSDYFILERSNDGRQFVEIATLAAAGFSFEPLDYEYYDQNPQPGQNYYRLRQVDYDGTTYDLGIVSVNFDQGGKPELGVFPNPAVDQTTVQWNTQAERLLLLDVQGRVLRQWLLSDSEFGGSQAIDLSAYPAGSYLLRLESKHDVLNQRLLIR